MLAISCASSTSPPPLPRRSNTSAARAGVQLVFDRFAHFGVRAGAEAGERHDAELDAVDGLGGGFDDRLGDDGAGDLDAVRRSRWSAAGGRRLDPELDVGAGQASDQRGGGFGGEAVRAATVDGDDHVPGLQPGARRGRGVEDAHDQQPVIARRAVWRRRRRCPVKCGGALNSRIFARGEVVREAVVEARDEAGRSRRCRACSWGSAGSSRARSAGSLRRQRCVWRARRRTRCAGSRAGLRDARPATGRRRAARAAAGRARGSAVDGAVRGHGLALA